MKKKLSKNSVFLNPGDAIEIIAPASACSHDEFEKAIQWVRDQGYKPVYNKNILKPEIYLAQSDQERFDQLKHALVNSKAKVIWCLRGGYGCLRLVPNLMKLSQKMSEKKPKFFIGLSDITILHYFLNKKWNWSTIHGPILARTASENKRTQDYVELFGLLNGKNQSVIFSYLKPVNSVAKKSKKSAKSIKAKVYGGNLCTFVTLLGTKLQPKLKNHFLFFEDAGERGYKVDRMLHQLQQAGIFNQCKGVFLGDFIDSAEKSGINYVPLAIEKFFKDSPFPVYSGIESDHSEKQRPLILNSKAILSYEETHSLTIFMKGIKA